MSAEFVHDDFSRESIMTSLEATPVPINTETGLEGKEITSFADVDPEKQEKLKWAAPKFWFDINWARAFVDADVEFTALGKPPLATNVVRMKQPILVQLPEALFPFGVNFGKNLGDTPTLGMAFSGPLGDAVLESYSKGDFFKGLHAFMQKHIGQMWPSKAGVNIDLNMMPFLLTKNTAKVNVVVDKNDDSKSLKIMNAKFYCIRKDGAQTMATKITKLTPEKKQEIVSINSIRPGSRGIVSLRIQQFPYKDTMAVTFEIMELVITKDPPEKSEAINTREELNNTSMINLNAEESYLQKRKEPEAAIEEVKEEAKKPAKKKKDAF